MGCTRMVSLAPEDPGALPLISRWPRGGAIAAAGHTDATYAQVREAVERVWRHATHTFNRTARSAIASPAVSALCSTSTACRQP